ncbi:MAG: antiterminator LoaP [Lachnospiraceae bacterium]|nr:antiterminator LoaP [Lachnospiraceae bacterium]
MSVDNLYWYVLFVRTGAEERVVKHLTNELGSDSYLPFVPQKTCIFRRQGKKSLFQKICFPGYVFIESDKSAGELLQYTYPAISKMKDSYRFLCYGDKINVAMRAEERIILNRILGADKRIDISRGFNLGDTVKVISGALVSNEGMILRINKNQNEAVIRISMFGTVISVSVGLEIIEQLDIYK